MPLFKLHNAHVVNPAGRRPRGHIAIELVSVDCACVDSQEHVLICMCAAHQNTPMLRAGNLESG